MKVEQEDIDELLAPLSKKYGVEIGTDGGSFSPEKFTIRVKGIVKGVDGTVSASESLHYLADMQFSMGGVPLTGYAIGSVWEIRGEGYLITDYSTKRPKYPFSLKTLDGRKSKAALNFIKQGFQIPKPSLADFAIWVKLDPEDDRITKEQETTYDNVNLYLSMLFPDSDGDKLFTLCEKLMETFKHKTLERHIIETYSLLFEGSFTGVNAANKYLQAILK